MERAFVLVLLTLATLKAGASAQNKTTTVDDIDIQEKQETLKTFSFGVFSYFNYLLVGSPKLKVTNLDVSVTPLPLKEEILEYVEAMVLNILAEITSNMGSIPVQSIYEDLNHHCADYLESPIVNLTEELSNVTCVSTRLKHMLTPKLNVEAGLQKFSRDCIQQRLILCQEVRSNCTTAYEGRLANLLSSYMIEQNSLADLPFGATPLKVMEQFVGYIARWVFVPYRSVYDLFSPRELSVSTNSSIQSQAQLAKGNIRLYPGNVDLACSRYRDIYSRESEEYIRFINLCFEANMHKSNLDLFSCVNTNRISNPLTWSNVPSVYFHSQCLCYAFNGTNCGVNTPQGVDPRVYCLSVLLRDFQSQVSYRLAITYLDHNLKTRVPVCRFTNLVHVSFSKYCQDSEARTQFNLILSNQCYFKGLVNTSSDCSKTQLVNTYNKTELCGLVAFMQNVLCVSDVDVEGPYYMTGDSPLLLFLSYGDIVMRVLTVITYLICPKLRNLIGMLLIGYLIATLLRLIVVRAILADMALAVRLDVATDLASTLCLTAYLHFLLISIRDLPSPDSLSPDEIRMVLLRYSLLGWVLPAALSVVFFSIDDAIDSGVQIGELLFLSCNFVVLFCNLYIFFRICSLYYGGKSKACEINPDLRKVTVFGKLFKFVIKTSVLSGAAIIFRLIFLQIQDLEQLLVYCHALDTLQGFLVFAFYGCNKEARSFWLQVFRSIYTWFCRRQNAPV